MKQNILEYFEDVCVRYPEKTALVDSVREVTFHQLRQEAVQIARGLKKLTGSRLPVAVYMEKSVDAVSSFLGAIYSGNFYSPIDPSMPMQRVQLILNTLEPAVLLTNRRYSSQAEVYGYPVLILEDLLTGEYGTDTTAPTVEISARDLLYVLFTSGSTGVPKGVMIRQESVINYITWLGRTFQIGQESSLGNQAPLYFDNSVLDLYSCIMLGATVHLLDKELFTQPVRLAESIQEKRIDTIFWVPSVFNFLVKFKTLDQVSLKGSLKTILFAGEVMPTKTLNYLMDHLEDTVFANLYGPTEATVDCTYYIINEKLDPSEAIPIGGPIDHVEILVLDASEKLVTQENEIGELCVKGCCLADGYYHNPEKTAESFVASPLNPKERIYKTGDLVKYDANGQLIYLSRKDQQIKHLGNRIELGEIEAVSLQIAKVNDSCCLYDNDKKRIVLFVESALDSNEIKKELKERLPSYMIPHRIVHLENFPVNLNGKTDRIKIKELM